MINLVAKIYVNIYHQSNLIWNGNVFQLVNQNIYIGISSFGGYTSFGYLRTNTLVGCSSKFNCYVVILDCEI